MTKQEVFKRVLSEMKDMRKYDLEKMFSEMVHCMKTGEGPKKGSKAHKFLLSAGIEE